MLFVGFNGRIPAYAMLDVWLALGGEPSPSIACGSRTAGRPLTHGRNDGLIRGDSLAADHNPPAGPESIVNLWLVTR
jgi:hypothetical protein